MIKWIFTGCFIVIIAFMAGGVGVVNEALGEEGLGGGAGSIYSIEGNAIVINDMKYDFSSRVKFLSKDGDSISKSNFKKGDKVSFVLNINNKIIILQKLK